MHGHVTEARLWLATALEAAPARASEARAMALDGAGYLAGEQGDADMKRALLEESLRCAKEVGSPAAVAIAATHLSLHLPAQEGLALGEEAVALARISGDRYTLAVALNTSVR
jgi:hypothetical protein